MRVGFLKNTPVEDSMNMCSEPRGMTGLLAFHVHSGMTPGVTKNQQAGSWEVLQQIRGRHSLNEWTPAHSNLSHYFLTEIW